MLRNKTGNAYLSDMKINSVFNYRNISTFYFEKIKPEGLRINILLAGYLLFTAGFFFFKNIKWHNNTFYAFIVIPYLCTIHKSYFRRFLINSRVFQMMLALVAYLMMTLLWSEGGVVREYLKCFSNTVSLLVFFAVTCELSFRYEWFPRFIFGWICSAATIAVGILLFTSSHISLPPARLDDIGVLRNAIQIGQVYGMIVLFLYFQFVLQGAPVDKRIIYLLTAVFLCTFFLTQSRGPLVSFYVILLVGCLLTRDKKLLLFLLCITVIPVIFIFQPKGFFHDLIISRSDSHRIEIYRYTMGLIFNKIWFGHGILNDYSYEVLNGITINHPHSLYLATWFYGGLAGLFLLLGFLLKTLQQGYKVFLQNKDLTLFVLVLYASICVATNNSKIIHHPVPMYLFLWMPVAVVAALELKEKTRDVMSVK